MSLDILVVGNGAREHALCWNLSQSDESGTILCAPGNAGSSMVAENVPVEAFDVDGLVNLALDRKVDLVVIGPEAPLAAGLADALRTSGVAVFGPSQDAARIESSKSWSKALMSSAGIPTARSVTHIEVDPAMEDLNKFDVPVVVKADGLAAGKGVIIAETRSGARDAVEQMLHGDSFGSAGSTIVIEEFLEGMEVSIFGITDGKSILPFLPSCDYKRAGTGDTGPNTGGMGAYAPVPSVDSSKVEEFLSTVFQPAIAAMQNQGSPMNGVLYAGLMLTDDGPRVLEFNARFGGPEIQVLLPLLQSDFARLLEAAAHGRLDSFGQLEWSEDCAVGVVAASGGYPGPYRTGFVVDGLDATLPGTEVFHAGTALSGDQIVTSGGRVLTAVATGPTFDEARSTAYRRLSQISFEDMEFRTDIAQREVASY